MKAHDIVEAAILTCPLRFAAGGFTTSEWKKIRFLHLVYMKEEGKLNRVRCECLK